MFRHSIRIMVGAVALTLAMASNASATVTYDFSTHAGFVGRGDVQTSLGKAALSTVMFREAQVNEYSYKCKSGTGFFVPRTARIDGGLTGLAFRNATLTRMNGKKLTNETGYLINGFAMAFPVLDMTFPCTQEGYPYLDMFSIRMTQHWDELRAYATGTATDWVVLATNLAIM